MNEQVDQVEQTIQTVTNKIVTNTLMKIQTKIWKLQEKYTLIEFTPNPDWKKIQLSLHCNDHGLFSLTGLETRQSKSCPECKVHHKEKLMFEYQNSSPTQRESLMRNEFKGIDWSEMETKEFLDLDHTIRPNCNEHGEFITTPRKLFSGDNCKWCDGIDIVDNEYTYPISSETFKKEKISIIYDIKPETIQMIDTTRFVFDGKVGDLLKLKKNEKYLKHLKEVRDPSSWNSILFKINVVDKSSKFQFSIVSRMSSLNEQWLNWYKEMLTLNPEDPEFAQVKATLKIIGIWFNTVFYNRQTEEAKDPFSYEIVWSFWSNTQRIETQFNSFKNDNSSKLMIIPKALQDKIWYNLKDINVDCYWSDVKWESTSNSVSLIRETLLNSTSICPICKETIDKPVVDHEHKKKVKGTGRIRNNICSNCNVFIAKAENNCKRYGINLSELPEVLKNVSEYFTEQQYNIIHYTDKDARPILSKTLANKILKYWDCIFPKKRKLKFPRSGILTKDWEDAIKAYEEYLKTPAKPFSKNEYKVLLRNIEIYNALVVHNNEFLPKTKKQKLLEIPEYPKLKLITPEIQSLMDITKLD